MRYFPYSATKLPKSQDFVAIVLLAIWTSGDLYPMKEDFTWLEFFAGTALCTAHVRARGNPGCRFDIQYHEERAHLGNSDFMDMNSVSGFVLGIIYLLRCRASGFVAWFGIKCSSWSSMNRGTSKRCPCSSVGDPTKPSVIEANMMLERTTLLLLLATALQGCWVVEQPGSSTLEYYPCFRYVLCKLAEVHGSMAVSRVSWWMSAYGARSAKRQFAYANSPEIRKIDRGTHQSRGQCLGKRVSTTYRYINSAGKKCYNGTKDLKGTEILIII
ncbi:unnamed protein product [Symbiodinium sp. CCMP2592]|nr:unnamed protein product [Symbiodinium sp. CCMP2592]CAE7834815.1 unnamed protein product [Symbiodinium sp. CCMP2592]